MWRLECNLFNEVKRIECMLFKCVFNLKCLSFLHTVCSVCPCVHHYERLLPRCTEWSRIYYRHLYSGGHGNWLAAGLLMTAHSKLNR
jgi:hypothetical protein